MTRTGTRKAWIAGVATLLLAGAASGAEVLKVRVGNHPTYTRVVFELSATAGYRVERQQTAGGASEIQVTLEAGATPITVDRKTVMVERVALDAGAGQSVAHIRLHKSPSRVKEMILANPPRIVFDLVFPEKQLAAIRRAREKKAAATAKAQPPKPAEPVKAAAPPAPKPAPTRVAAEKPAPKPATKPSPPETTPEPPRRSAPAPTPVAVKPEPKRTAKTEKPAPEKIAKAEKPAPEKTAKTEKPAPAAKPEPPSTVAKKAAPPAPEAAPAAKPKPAPPSPAKTAKTAEPKASLPELAPKAAPAPRDDPAARLAAKEEPAEPGAAKPPAAGVQPPPARKVARTSPAAKDPKSAAKPGPAPAPDAGFNTVLWGGVAGGLLLLLVVVLMLRRRRSLPNDMDVTAVAEEHAADGAIPDGGFAMDAPLDQGDSAPAESAFAAEPVSHDVPSVEARAEVDIASGPGLFDDDEPEKESEKMDLERQDLPKESTASEMPTQLGGDAAAGGDVARLVRDLERRVAQMEARLDESTEARERLERQVAAQAEELRVQRAAIARTQRALRSLNRPADEQATEPAIREGSS